MSVTSRYTIHPPQLVGRLSVPRPEEDVVLAVRRMVGEFDGAMQELQRFLKYLMDSTDQTQVNVQNVDNSVTNLTTITSTTQLQAGRQSAHTHQRADLVGLEPEFAPRRPAAHLHRVEDVQAIVGDTQLILASRVFGR